MSLYRLFLIAMMLASLVSGLALLSCRAPAPTATGAPPTAATAANVTVELVASNIT